MNASEHKLADINHMLANEKKGYFVSTNNDVTSQLTNDCRTDTFLIISITIFIRYCTKIANNRLSIHRQATIAHAYLQVDTVTITEAAQLEITAPQLECVTDCSLLSPLHHHPHLPQTEGRAGATDDIHHPSVRHSLQLLSPTHTAATTAAAATAQLGLSVL